MLTILIHPKQIKAMVKKSNKNTNDKSKDDKVDKLIHKEIKGLKKTYKPVTLYNEGREALLPKIFNTALNNNKKLDKLVQYSVVIFGGIVVIISILLINIIYF